MAKFGEVLFSGSRFIFWTLSPCLLLFATGLPLLTRFWSVENTVLTVVLSGASLLLILALYDPKRFRWAARSVTGVAFLTFLVYFTDEVHQGHRWRLGLTTDSPWSAFFGLVSIGLPCLRYAVWGCFGASEEPAPGDSDHKRD